MTPAAERFEVAREGVRLVGDRWGAASARGSVALLHGGGQTRHSWRRTAERLAAGGFEVAAYDARGHGESGWAPDGDYTLDAFVADLLAVAGVLSEPPALVGASLGGMTSLLAAGEGRMSASALVLVDIVVAVDRGGAGRIIEFLTAHRDGFATLEEAADAIAAYNPLRPRPGNLDGLRRNLRRREDGRWHWHWDPAFVRIGDEPQRAADPARLRAAAANVRVPTLLVRGGRSEVVTDEGVADMLTLIPQAQVALVPGAGHMVAGDDNDAFVAGLEAFLAEVR